MDEVERFLAEANQFATISTLDERIQFLEQGIRRFPQDPRLFTDLGQVHMFAGDWEKALLYSTKAVELNAANVDALYNTARCHLYADDLPRAMQSFQAALRCAPGDLEILDNLAMVEAAQAVSSSPASSFEPAILHQREWARLQPRFTFSDDDLLFRLAVNLKRHNKFSGARACLERIHHDSYPDRSANLTMLRDLTELGTEIDALIRDPAGTMRIPAFLGGAAPIIGSLDRIRTAPDETWVRLAYYVVELSFDHFTLFESLDTYVREKRLPPALPEHQGVHWSPMIHLTTGVLHDLLTHFGSPTTLQASLRQQPVWGKVQNARVLRLLTILMDASAHRPTAVSLHGALGIVSKAPQDINGHYLRDLLDILTRHWHEWGSTPAFEGQDFE